MSFYTYSYTNSLTGIEKSAQESTKLMTQPSLGAVAADPHTPICMLSLLLLGLQYHNYEIPNRLERNGYACSVQN